jgi:hypothetical protein
VIVRYSVEVVVGVYRTVEVMVMSIGLCVTVIVDFEVSFLVIVLVDRHDTVKGVDDRLHGI